MLRVYLIIFFYTQYTVCILYVFSYSCIYIIYLFIIKSKLKICIIKKLFKLNLVTDLYTIIYNFGFASQKNRNILYLSGLPRYMLLK